VLGLVVMIGLSCSVIVGRALPGAAPFALVRVCVMLQVG
jgi:hypothetical protein